jgi:hypothetical protein
MLSPRLCRLADKPWKLSGLANLAAWRLALAVGGGLQQVDNSLSSTAPSLTRTPGQPL